MHPSRDADAIAPIVEEAYSVVSTKNRDDEYELTLLKDRDEQWTLEGAGCPHATLLSDGRKATIGHESGRYEFEDDDHDG